MTLYEQFLQLNLDFSQIGLEQRTDPSDYYCSPLGARPIGWTGVDGIHFCQINTLGDTIFAISPMNPTPDQVLPLAKNFKDFLRLTLACGVDAAEQAHLWDAAQFDAFLLENPPTPQQSAILDTIKTSLHLTPMEHPYQYIRELQKSFDYSQIPYPPDYYDLLEPEQPDHPEPPEWKVFWGEGFYHHEDSRQSGTEIPLHLHFTWGDRNWVVPAVYLCDEGPVLDFCMEGGPEQISAFLEHWTGRQASLTREEQAQMSLENPLSFDFRAQIELNGQVLRPKCGSGFSWVPLSCWPEDMRQDELSQQNREALWTMDHYGLDAARGWMFWRASFLWQDGQKQSLEHGFRLCLEQEPVSIPAGRIQVSEARVGERIPLIHPVTGQEYRLNVLEFGPCEMDASRLPDQDWEYPTHYAAMNYTVTPDLPRESFTLSDCAKGEQARPNPNAFTENVQGAAAIGIIGGSDGPTAFLMTASPKDAQTRTALSMLHFEPVEKVEWLIEFREKQYADFKLDFGGLKSTDVVY